MIKLKNKYYQQIILACKGHSKYDKYEAVRNIIGQMIEMQVKFIDDHIIYKHLIKILYNIDEQSNLSLTKKVLEKMFYKHMFFNIERSEINIVEVNKDIISLLSNIIVLDEEHNRVIGLHKNNKILNGKII